MQEGRVTLPLPLVGAIGATRGLLGLGIGLLVADRLDDRPRKILALALLGVGAATTIPLAMAVFRRRKAAKAEAPATKKREVEPRMVH
jgi:hypothetical protein